MLSGCVTLTTERPASPAAPAAGDPFPAVGLGMKRDQVVALLDREITIGYEQDSVSGEFKPLKARSLYSTELLEKNGVSYLVDSYMPADVKTGTPSESELYPLIFQNGVLVGKGRAELDRLKSAP